MCYPERNFALLRTKVTLKTPNLLTDKYTFQAESSLAPKIKILEPIFLTAY